MKSTDHEEQRLAMRNTPEGQFLWSMGMDYYDTESSARRVAEEAVRQIAKIKTKEFDNGDLVEAYNLTSETHGELHVAFVSASVADKWLLQFARNVLEVSR